MIQHAIAGLLGLTNASGDLYLFWSGIFGDVSIFAAVAMLYWHHTCHVDNCLRFGRHPVNGTTYTTCRKHHPADATTEGTIATAHARAHSIGDQT